MAQNDGSTMSTRNAYEKPVLKDQTPIGGCCCSMTSLYMKWPECIGCHQEFELCCLELKAIGCKPIYSNPLICCICVDGSFNVVPPKVCIKGTNQCFCCDNRCALPCDSDLPCILNCWGLNLTYNVACVIKCCATIGDIEIASGTGKGAQVNNPMK